MQIFRCFDEIKSVDFAGSVGFVPTMGGLHEGHLSLVRAAVGENKYVIVSIFVNPAQFLPGEDFEKYSRDEAGDIAKLQTEDVDVVFIPSVDAVYDHRHLVDITFPSLTNCMCGVVRPGHFEGVALVLAKFFHIINPTVVYLGQKDYQQAVVVKQMIEDLNYPVKFRMLPTVRDEDGIAMSSRNKYLTSSLREKAVLIYKCLCEVRDKISAGERNVPDLIRFMKGFSLVDSEIKLAYADIRIADDLRKVDLLDSGKYVIALGVFISETYLIDNILIDV